MWYGCQQLHITLAQLKGLALWLGLQDQVCCNPLAQNLHFQVSCLILMFNQVTCDLSNTSVLCFNALYHDVYRLILLNSL